MTYPTLQSNPAGAIPVYTGATAGTDNAIPVYFVAMPSGAGPFPTSKNLAGGAMPVRVVAKPATSPALIKAKAGFVPNFQISNGLSPASVAVDDSYDDWLVWPGDTLTPIRRAAGTGELTSPTLLGRVQTLNGFPQGSDARTVGWTGGTPTGSGTTTGGIYQDGGTNFQQGEGLRFRVNASPLPRRLTVYWSNFTGQPQIAASFDDGSALPAILGVPMAAEVDGVYDYTAIIDFQALTNTMMTLDITQQGYNGDPEAQIALQAVAISTLPQPGSVQNKDANAIPVWDAGGPTAGAVPVWKTN